MFLFLCSLSFIVKVSLKSTTETKHPFSCDISRMSVFYSGSDHLYDDLEQHLILPVTAQRKLQWVTVSHTYQISPDGRVHR